MHPLWPSSYAPRIRFLRLSGSSYKTARVRVKKVPGVCFTVAEKAGQCRVEDRGCTFTTFTRLAGNRDCVYVTSKAAEMSARDSPSFEMFLLLVKLCVSRITVGNVRCMTLDEIAGNFRCESSAIQPWAGSTRVRKKCISRSLVVSLGVTNNIERGYSIIDNVTRSFSKRRRGAAFAKLLVSFL